MSSEATRPAPTKFRAQPRSLSWRVLLPIGLAMLLIAAVSSLVMYTIYRHERVTHLNALARVAMAGVQCSHDAGVSDEALDRAVAEIRSTDAGEGMALLAAGDPLVVTACTHRPWESMRVDALPSLRLREELDRVGRGAPGRAGVWESADDVLLTARLDAQTIALIAVGTGPDGGTDLRSAGKVASVAVAGLIAFGAFTLVTLRRRVTGPLKRLAERAKLGAPGAPGQLAADAQHDEVSQLAAAMDSSRAQLAKSTEEIERLATSMRSTTNSVLSLDTGACITWANEAFTRNTGYALDEVMGRRPSEFLLSPAADSSACQAFDDAIRERRACRVELPYAGKDGRERWMTVDLQPTQQEDGTMIGFTVVHTDITAEVHARSELLKSERRQKLIVAGADLGTWDWNIATGDVVFNDRWCRMLGYEPTEIEPHVRSWEKVLHPEDGDLAWKALTDHFEGRADAYRCEHRLRAKDGSVIWVLDAGRVYERDADGKPLRMAGIHLDITKRRMAEERFELVVKGSAAAIWDWNIVAGNLQMSPRWQEQLGYAPDEFPTAFDQFMELVHPADRALIQVAVDQHLTARDPFSKDLRIKDRAGEYRWFHAHGQASWNNDGRPIRMVGSLEDIHAQRQAEAARARLASLVDSSEDAVLSLTLSGCIVTCNDATCRMFGMSRDELIGASALRLAPAAERKAVRRALKQLAAGERVQQYETIRTRADGRKIEVSVSMFAVRDPDGQIVGAAKVIRDISLRREKRELEELNALLARQNHKLELMTERAHRFVDDVSHEFRTPLTVIKEYTSIIADGLGGPVSEKQAGWLQVIDVAAVDLNQMVEDFLDSSKLRAGRLRVDRRPCTAEGILDGVRGLISRKASSRSIQVRQVVEPGLPPVFADAEKVRRIVMNLVTNAIKFSPDGGVVTLSAKCLENGDVEFGVSDQGPGLAPADMRQIFERFRQLPNALAPSVKGFGLGLNIARQLVWLNLGTIRVESEQGKGATFSFTLPAVRMDAVIDRFFDRLAEREEAPESVAMLRLWPDEVEGRESLAELRRLAVASTRPSDIVVEDRDGSSIVLFGPTSSPATWQAHILEGLVRRNKHGGDGPRVELVGVWSYPDTTGEGREAIRAVVLKEATHAA